MIKEKFASICALLVASMLTFSLSAQDDTHTSDDHGMDDEHLTEEHKNHSTKEYTDLVLHHIADANEFHIVGDFSIPLPVILFDLEENSFLMTMSSAFHHGHTAVDGFVMDHGNVKKVLGDFPDGKVEISKIKHTEGNDSYAYFNHEGEKYKLGNAASLLAFENFIDLSISKVVVTLMFSGLLLILIFLAVKRGFKKNEGKAPSGIQSFMEPFIIFIRDEVMIPAMGDRWERFFPFIATLFFFIAINNLIGLVPIFPGSGNTMGNLAVTLGLALITFTLTIFNGNKHYWAHILWMPGVPVVIRPILTVIEIMGMFTKPFTLLIRLFANITAGHIIILSLVGIIFMLGNNGQNIGGTIGGTVIAVPFLIAMNFLEIFVALLQAFIFALLSALYIGEATEEAH